MKVGLLKPNEVREFSRITREVIMSTRYYPTYSREDQVSWYTPSKLREKLKNKDLVFIVARKGKKMVGFCMGYYEAGGVFYITWIGVAKEARNNGVATNLVKHVEQEMKRKKMHKIACDIQKDNKESISFFENIGFEKMAEFKKHWYNLDYYVYSKRLRN